MRLDEARGLVLQAPHEHGWGEAFLKLAGISNRSGSKAYFGLQNNHFVRFT